MNAFATEKYSQGSLSLDTHDSAFSIAVHCRLQQMVCIGRIWIGVRHSSNHSWSKIIRVHVKELGIVNGDEPGEQQICQSCEHIASVVMRNGKLEHTRCKTVVVDSFNLPESKQPWKERPCNLMLASQKGNEVSTYITPSRMCSFACIRSNLESSSIAAVLCGGWR